MKINKPTKQQIEQAMSAYCSSEISVNESLPKDLQLQLASVKELFNVHIWELFIKQNAYWAEINGEDVNEFFENWDAFDMLEDFAEWQVGYWEGVNEAKKENKQ